MTILEDNHPTDTYVYLVTVVTGWRDGAGTSSTVAMFMTGEDGVSERHLLTDSRKEIFKVFEHFVLPKSLNSH